MSFLVLDICISELLNIGYRTWAMYVIFKHFLKLNILLNNCMFNFCTEVKNHIIILYRIVFESYHFVWFSFHLQELYGLQLSFMSFLYCLILLKRLFFFYWCLILTCLIYDLNIIILYFVFHKTFVLSTRHPWNGDISKVPA